MNFQFFEITTLLYQPNNRRSMLDLYKMTLCPGKSFALDFLFTVAIKIVSELYLSFDGFIDNAHDNSTALGGESTFFTVSSWLAGGHLFTRIFPFDSKLMFKRAKTLF